MTTTRLNLHGLDGAPATQPTFTVNSVTTLSPGTSAYVHISGGPVAWTLDIGIPAGTNGADGSTPTFSIGTVSTLAAGSSATATITGGPAYSLNLGIPKGDTGAGGGDTVYYGGSGNIVEPLGHYNGQGQSGRIMYDAKELYGDLSAGGTPVITEKHFERVEYVYQYTPQGPVYSGKTYATVAVSQEDLYRGRATKFVLPTYGGSDANGATGLLVMLPGRSTSNFYGREFGSNPNATYNLPNAQGATTGTVYPYQGASITQNPNRIVELTVAVQNDSTGGWGFLFEGIDPSSYTYDSTAGRCNIFNLQFTWATGWKVQSYYATDPYLINATSLIGYTPVIPVWTLNFSGISGYTQTVDACKSAAEHAALLSSSELTAVNTPYYDAATTTYIASLPSGLQAEIKKNDQARIYTFTRNDFTAHKTWSLGWAPTTAAEVFQETQAGGQSCATAGGNSVVVTGGTSSRESALVTQAHSYGIHGIDFTDFQATYNVYNTGIGALHELCHQIDFKMCPGGQTWTAGYDTYSLNTKRMFSDADGSPIGALWKSSISGNTHCGGYARVNVLEFFAEAMTAYIWWQKYKSGGEANYASNFLYLVFGSDTTGQNAIASFKSIVSTYSLY